MILKRVLSLLVLEFQYLSVRQSLKFLVSMVSIFCVQRKARDNHLLLVTLPDVHRFQKNLFTDRLGSKPLIIWLLTTPSHLKYVSTLPCNLSLITCLMTLMFHKVVWQHMQRVLGFLITTLLQICHRIFQ